jgi:hypothetical protein
VCPEDSVVRSYLWAYESFSFNAQLFVYRSSIHQLMLMLKTDIHGGRNPLFSYNVVELHRHGQAQGLHPSLAHGKAARGESAHNGSNSVARLKAMPCYAKYHTMIPTL